MKRGFWHSELRWVTTGNFSASVRTASSALPHHPLATGPKARLQHLLVDLADAGHRQLGDELDVFWRVRRTFLGFHQIDQLVRARPGAFARDYDGGDGLAPFVVGHADHRA